jgi:hypothetical protein
MMGVIEAQPADNVSVVSVKERVDMRASLLSLASRRDGLPGLCRRLNSFLTRAGMVLLTCPVSSDHV